VFVHSVGSRGCSLVQVEEEEATMGYRSHSPTETWQLAILSVYFLTLKLPFVSVYSSGPAGLHEEDTIK